MVAIETTVSDIEEVTADYLKESLEEHLDVKSIDVAELGPIDCYDDDKGD